MVSAQSSLPAVGCGAVILNDAGHILLLRRLKQPEAGCWGLPGGKVDPFETVPTAVIREVQEETGLNVQLGALLCVVDQIDQAAGAHWVAPVYRVQNYTGQPHICEPHKHNGLEWFALDALPQPLTIATQQAVAALKDLAA
ncbi:ADP-ribose pyrophosphatase [Acetobacter pomorum DSM 11825]|uniref:NUDIX hydrolase n=1 Tax=Acetobacter pomorum TaxID=65959 RepID=UPI001605CB0E|nr:NUDIX domain-containing protein [Acetobacter pomorum]GBR54103.1 ADP-ribose pyrophosphatase [Acetobacter pomorum DSM 11825]